jgi:polyhydroxybutyrate depolymerase
MSIAFLIAALLTAGCAPSLRELPDQPPGTYRVPAGTTYWLAHRKFLLHVPPGYRADGPLPLVVVLHGAFSTGGQTETETGFSDLADAEGFLVAYPEGIGIFGLLQHWNAGHCCGKAATDGVDDVGFLAEVIAAVRKNLSVDPERIYMAGMSNGGMLAYRFAAERTGDLAAIAVVSGAIGSSADGRRERWVPPKPEGALPVVVLHGLADETIPVGGGTGPAGGRRSYVPVDNAIEFWRNANGCRETPEREISRRGKVQRTTWDDCRDGSAVESWLLAGWGHLWPAPYFTDRPDVDESLRGFDATRRIWEFFKRFRRPGSAGIRPVPDAGPARESPADGGR